MASFSLQEVKGVLQKFFIEKGTENGLPLALDSAGDEKNSPNARITHRAFVNTLLRVGLSDLQTALFRALLEDVSIILKLKNWVKKAETQEDKANYLDAIGVIQNEMGYFTAALSTIDLNSIKFESLNEWGFLTFFDDLAKSYRSYYPRFGKTIYGNLPEYEELVKKFLTAYLECVNSFYIMLSKKAFELQELTPQMVMEEKEDEEDDLFFMETHNFFMSILRYFSGLTYNYHRLSGIEAIKDINFLAELLRKLAKIYDGNLSQEDAKEFYEFIDGGNLVANPPIGSYYRKWLYSKANELKESISR